VELHWKKLRQEVKQIGHRKLTIKYFEMPDGREDEYTTWYAKSDNVAVIPITAEGKVVIARQYRPGPEIICDELPGGGTETGEKLEAAAARELREETGYVSDEPLIYIGAAHRNAYSNATDHYFLAKNCYRKGVQELDKNEFIEVEEISIAQLIDNAKQGKVSDGVAVLMALDTLKTLL
jgi:ADP-ribose pyrophosphatase